MTANIDYTAFTAPRPAPRAPRPAPCALPSNQLPGDLRSWAGCTGLRELVLTEIAKLDWQNPEVVGYLSRYPAYRPQVLLAVLAYAYAIGEYESDCIAVACEQDGDFRALCDGKGGVAAQDLVKFRRANRPLIEEVLKRVFCALRPALCDASGVAFSRGIIPADDQVCRTEAKRRLDIARHFDTLD